MSEKDALIESWEKEIPVTLKVLKAFPEDKADFKPHEKSKTAIQLAWIFATGQTTLKRLFDGTFKPIPDFPPPPARWAELIQAFQTESAKASEEMKAAEDSVLHEKIKIIDPYAGHPEWKELPKSFFMWFLLSDHIHHRGQLSVYLRLAGGKVPSIYGPSADEPWR